jgi:signal transduction histidine kinase
MQLAGTVEIRPIAWRSAVGWINLAATVALIAVALTLTVADRRPVPGDPLTGATVGLMTAFLAAFIVSRHPGNAIGWLLAVSGLTRAVAIAATAWCVHGLPGTAFASWLQAWLIVPSLALTPMIAVLFPDGRLPGRGWRVVPAMVAIALVLLTVVVPVGIWPYRGPRLMPGAPVPDTPGARTMDAVVTVGIVLTALALVLALISVIFRARAARHEQRQQIKWFGLGAAFGFAFNTAGLIPGFGWIRVIGAVCVFTGFALGIFRYRLYDVDRLINRTVVYGALSVLLGGAFAALDVTIALVAGERSIPVAAVSAFVVALLLRPARERVQDVVDRFYDRRTHSAVRRLRALGDRVGHEPVEPAQVRDTLRAVLRDPRMDVGYYTRSGLLVDGDGNRFIAPQDRPVETVRSGGEPIAALVHDGIDVAILHRLTPAAAVALAHARLHAELQVQVAEVRASRTRLVTTADAERRRIERDLHDGAQQRLVGLAVHIQSTRRRLAPSPEVLELLTFTVEQLQAGVDEIRALVHGILSPTLATSGLPAALAELGRAGGIEIICDLPGRPAPEIEATAWFVACEGVANATKHGGGRPARVAVTATAEALVILVADDGPGGADPDGDGLRNLADRVEAHGGVLTVDSLAGAGTRLTAELPCAW